MGQLEVVFRIGLAYRAVVLPEAEESPIMIEFVETGNTVQIDVPEIASASLAEIGVYAVMPVHVRRECTDADGLDGSYENPMRLHIPTDAGPSFLAALRDGARRRV